MGIELIAAAALTAAGTYYSAQKQSDAAREGAEKQSQAQRSAAAEQLKQSQQEAQMNQLQREQQRAADKAAQDARRAAEEATTPEDVTTAVALGDAAVDAAPGAKANKRLAFFKPTASGGSGLNI